MWFCSAIGFWLCKDADFGFGFLTWPRTLVSASRLAKDTGFSFIFTTLTGLWLQLWSQGRGFIPMSVNEIVWNQTFMSFSKISQIFVFWASIYIQSQEHLIKDSFTRFKRFLIFIKKNMKKMTYFHTLLNRKIWIISL